MLCFYLPSYPFRGSYAPYLWLYFLILDRMGKEKLTFITGKEYLNSNEEWKCFAGFFRPEFDDKTQKNMGYSISPKEEWLKHEYRFLSEDIFSTLLKKAGDDPLKLFKCFLTERIEEFEDELEAIISDVSAKEKLEGIVTIINSPSLEYIGKKFNIPIIHIELGPLRSPQYRKTGYFDFKGVNGNTEAEERFLKDPNDFLNIDLEIGQLREFFGLSEDSGTTFLNEYNAGIIMQVDSDSNLIAYGNGFLNISLLHWALIQEKWDKVLVRAHPGSYFEAHNLLGRQSDRCS